MLTLISDSHIVSADTLRPDHLCAALISEADRLGITLDRDLWTLSLDAQCEAINSDPKGKFEAKTLEVPEHWLSALINSDESGLDDKESAELKAFCDGELSDNWHVSSYYAEGEFMKDHDAQPYGVLACDAVKILAMRVK
jgi:hypothetical protein